MGLADRYKETLKNEGVNVKIDTYKRKADKTKLYVAIIVVAFGIPLFFMISQNYSYCTADATNILHSYGGSGVGGSFYLKCGTNAALYSSAAFLVLAISAMLMIKIVKYRKM